MYQINSFLWVKSELMGQLVQKKINFITEPYLLHITEHEKLHKKTTVCSSYMLQLFQFFPFELN